MTDEPRDASAAAIAGEPPTQAHSEQTKDTRVWDKIAALTAIGLLIAAVVFGAIEAADARTALDDNRVATELQQLTQLDASIRAANGVFGGAAFDAIASRRRYLEDHWTSPLARQTRVALGNLDYIAFLLDNKDITLPEARERWQGSITCAWQRVAQVQMPDEAGAQWPNLEAAAKGQQCAEGAQPTPQPTPQARPRPRRDRKPAPVLPSKPNRPAPGPSSPPRTTGRAPSVPHAPSATATTRPTPTPTRPRPQPKSQNKQNQKHKQRPAPCAGIIGCY